MLLIGSQALNHNQRVSSREPVDYDFIAFYDEFKEYHEHLKNSGELVSCVPYSESKFVIRTKSKIIEIDIAWDGTTNYSLLEIVANNPATLTQQSKSRDWIASFDLLYTLKMSHRFKKNSPHFRKTVDDIALLRSLGATIPDTLKTWFKEREKETYNYSHPKLNQSKKDFFKDDNITYVYDHDSIHEAVKTLDKPAYQYFKVDGAEVKCSKKKFDAQPEHVKLAAVLEESYVLALERSQIPHGDKVSPERSFEIALEKVCTSITSGWFREYAWENYYAVLNMMGDYVSLFNDGLNNGIVIKLNNV